MELQGGSAKPSGGVLIGKIDTEMALPVGRVRLLSFESSEYDVWGTLDTYRLELSLKPGQNAGGVCFPDTWNPHQFEVAGELFMLPPGQPMHSRGSTKARQSITCDFYEAQLHEWFEGECDWTNKGLHAVLNMNSPAIRASLRRLAQEMRSPGFAHDAVCELIAAQTALDLARHCRLTNETAWRGGLSPYRLKLIEDRIEEIASPPTLGELSKACGISVRHLARAFRISKNCSIGEYITEKRLGHAVLLLQRGAAVKEVAHRLGFSSTGNFSTAFKRSLGCSPREFRSSIG